MPLLLFYQLPRIYSNLFADVIIYHPCYLYCIMPQSVSTRIYAATITCCFIHHPVSLPLPPFPPIYIPHLYHFHLYCNTPIFLVSSTITIYTSIRTNSSNNCAHPLPKFTQYSVSDTAVFFIPFLCFFYIHHHTHLQLLS